MDHTGRSRETLRRWITLYGFPKGHTVKNYRGRMTAAWQQYEIDNWMKANPDLLKRPAMGHRSLI